MGLLGNLAKHYGRKSGLVRHWWYLWRHRLGLLRGYSSVDWSRIDRLIFVCQGNICRSPYAEFRARSLGLHAASFGLHAFSPDSAHDIVQRLAGENALDLSSHRSRGPSELVLTDRDLLLGMEPWHGEQLRRLAADSGVQVTLLGLWATHARPHIEDPFGLSADYFRTCLGVIDDALANIARLCRERHCPATGWDCDPSWWKSRPVLVAEAQTLGAVGVIRSLGRAGYPVHACAAQADAIGLHSNYAAAAVVCPRYDEPRFLDWLRAYIAIHNIRAIIPSEGMLLALRPAFEEFLPLLPFSRQPETLYAGMSKCDVYQALVAGGAAEYLPPSLMLEADDPPPALDDLKALGSPLFLKVDACYSREGQGSKVRKAVSAEDALAQLADLRHGYDKVLIQGFVAGQGVGAFSLWWDNRLAADFMHRRLHEVPHDGGVSSLRESCLLPEVRADALAKLRCLGWEGIAMMEYRWDERTGKYYFLELNGRFWGSLHLALFAGVDFPALLVDAFFGRMTPQAPRYPQGVRCRHTFPGEVQYVWSRVNGRGVSLLGRAWSLLEFLLLGLNPRIRSDLLFPGDRKLYWLGFRQYVRTGLRALGRRLGKREAPLPSQMVDGHASNDQARLVVRDVGARPVCSRPASDS